MRHPHFFHPHFQGFSGNLDFQCFLILRKSVHKHQYAPKVLQKQQEQKHHWPQNAAKRRPRGPKRPQETLILGDLEPSLRPNGQACPEYTPETPRITNPNAFRGISKRDIHIFGGGPAQDVARRCKRPQGATKRLPRGHKRASRNLHLGRSGPEFASRQPKNVHKIRPKTPEWPTKMLSVAFQNVIFTCKKEMVKQFHKKSKHRVSTNQSNKAPSGPAGCAKRLN